MDYPRERQASKEAVAAMKEANGKSKAAAKALKARNIAPMAAVYEILVWKLPKTTV